MNYIGIDLAWSTKNATGIACVTHRSITDVAIVHTIDDILRFVKNHLPAYIAIDAPLTVPNDEGSRGAEQALNKDFRTFHAGAHPANRKRLSMWGNGMPRGEELVHALEKVGVAHATTGTTSICFECYPHSASIVLFGLKKIIPYKARAHRTYEDRWKAFSTYRNFLQGQVNSHSLLLEPVEKKGKALKEYEDKLDAVMCAIIARYAHLHPNDMTLYGSMEEGYIYTPSLKEK